MPKTLIQQCPTFTKKVEGENKLAIAEHFIDTLQGEGFSSGCVASFLRLQGCTLECKWCDTLEVWRYGNEYSFDEIFQLWEDNDVINKFKAGQHLVLTGGSPLKQQDRLIEFIKQFMEKYRFKPYIEIENECTIMPKEDMVWYIDQWNNSPKLSNSGMKEKARLKPEIIKDLCTFSNSWFKFVISSKEDWGEIERDYMPHIKWTDSIILMPEGVTQEELNKNRTMVADLAIEKGVRFTDRLHITLWDKKTGV